MATNVWPFELSIVFDVVKLSLNMEMCNFPPTLLKYEEPVQVTKYLYEKEEKQKKKRLSSPVSTASGYLETPEETGVQDQIETRLDDIFPPREYEKDGKLWVQCVSSERGTRVEITNLQQKLNMALLEENARLSGICPIRRRLYDQCFDELIRQVTIESVQHGWSLLKVKEEIQITMAAFEELCESGILFGMRKAAEAKEAKITTNEQIKQSESKRDELVQQVADLKLKCESIEKNASKRRSEEELKHAQELKDLKQVSERLKAQLDKITSAMQ